MAADVAFPPDARIEKEARALIGGGHSVSLICLKGKKKAHNGMQLIHLPFGESRLPKPLNWVFDYVAYSSIGLLYAYWFSRGKRVVHVHNPPEFFVPLLIPLKLFGKRIILDVHDPTPVLARSRLHKPESHWLIRILKFFLDAASWSADYVITISPQVAKLLKKKAIVVPNSPGDEFFIKLKKPKGKIAIYTGAMVGGRGLELLVRAMKRVDGTLLMVGKGDLLPHLKEIAPDNVKFTGEVPYSQIPSHLQNSAVAVLPFEPTPINTLGSPNKLYEYMALGMPIVCTDLPGPKRIAKGAALFVEYSEEGFARGINELLENKALAGKLGKKARAIAEKEFRWSVASKPLLRLYSSI